MEFSWISETKEPEKVRLFLKARGVSHRMFSQIKHFGGKIVVEGREVFTNDYVKNGEKITIFMPPESENVELDADFTDPLKVVFEDKNFLIVDKPAFVTTVPGHADRKTTLVNMIKAHLIQEKADSLVPHVVTRLDRDTSGLVLLAKHKFAHALLNDALMEHHDIEKFYVALVSGNFQEDHGMIDEPIGRIEGDFIRRQVRQDGKRSVTEYWVEKRFDNFTQLRIQLHTGRTHQIRVHMAWAGHPLIGDVLYGGPHSKLISRQALHASEMIFFDPFANKNQHFNAGLPDDIQRIIEAENY
ncbi:RNA pseudouridine synthase [Oenococcus oeni]|uniref:Pseudouridine synthase n=1 Tax=Oenococcus oeni TaxID=1247 RepID=A0A6N4A1B0_OENOE|nr:RluA family pseudouridine synthase [Oenococcus oeni]MDV7686332.1 RluA family pseudouridine synthase [Oenococcus oeni]MDV7714603.1 RluA family pseudouridine synthase [Oenococcus oeni]OIK86512.1 RNA pseudouridine synthase [Oenococcus oeni]OIL08865.1 RNA pseudouridine synthase [Oenococcus oeni]OIL14015.1 RNA pseudouridine synthase [Oenococcus oeni]